MLTDPQAFSTASDTPGMTNPTLPPFLLEAASKHLGEVVAVYTGWRSYVGRLQSLDAVRLILDADSDELDQEVLLHIDTKRVEAIGLLPR